MSIPYRFMPFARRGLARAHTNADAAGGGLAAQPRITVGLTLQAKQDGNAVSAVSGNVPLRLYGPADIIGIDQRLVVRTDPKPNTTDFEPNYLAAVDFDPPDFPWLLTPARADAAGRLRPWLVLVVLQRRPDFALPAVKPGQPLPSISLSLAQVRDELPDLDESWLWAHAQAVSEAPDAAALAAQLNAEPARNVSRLVCPRRLQPRTDYVACVVPATDGGCLRGLGKPVAAAAVLGRAWDKQASADTELPVYFSWTFSTGPVGDIETLARRLRTPAQYGGDAALKSQLRTIGQRDVWVDGDRLLFDGTQPGQTVFEGAMVSIGFTPAIANQTYAGKLASMLNSGAQRLNGAQPGETEPTLAPPIYGEHPARRHTVATASVASHWLDGLSLQPRYRLVAGWGAEVVRQHQDEFMQAAWEQLGDILAAERAFSMARLARDVLKRIEVRHLAKLPPARVLALMAPARARVALAPSLSLYGRIENATLPHELFDGAMRRLASPRRAALKMARWRERAAALPTVDAQMATLVERFANASKHLDAIDPNRFVPDGILGSKSYDVVPLPAVLDDLIDLKPYTGLELTLSGHQLKALQEANAAARQYASVTKKKLQGTGETWRQGLLTETHMMRIEQLQAAAGAPLAGDVVSAIRNSSKRGNEGVLLAVKNGVVTSQALRIDGRSGALKTAGAALRAHDGPGALRAAARDAVAMTRVASVPLQALKLYGNRAVFATLPPSTMGRNVADVHVGLGGAGRFTQVPPAEPGAPVTITMPPALKDRATLSRYSAAFKAYQKTLVPPADTGIALQAIDFAVAANATQLQGAHRRRPHRAGAAGQQPAVGRTGAGAGRRSVRQPVLQHQPRCRAGGTAALRAAAQLRPRHGLPAAAVSAVAQARGAGARCLPARRRRAAQ